MKFFRDAVHGRIPVRKEFCTHLIDTPQFQRLRRIEQTSMRDLYPSARHDRFIHSLGTYHIGRMMGEQIKADGNFTVVTEVGDSVLSKDELESLIKNFEAACLLHDCGHAPFSHSFERYFKFVKGWEDDMIKAAIKCTTKQLPQVSTHNNEEDTEKCLLDFFKSPDCRKNVEDFLYLASEEKEQEKTIERSKELNLSEDKVEEARRIQSDRKGKKEASIQHFYSGYKTFINTSLPNYEGDARRLLLQLVEFFIDSKLVEPKAHEEVSAWLVMHEEGFGKILREKLKLNPLLIARMICGYEYKNFEGIVDDRKMRRENEVHNCFISLLNGKVIDADKLDYCLRDKWASGVNVNHIEMHKLVQSLSICEHGNKAIVCYGKGTISEIEAVLDAKNKVAFWCHNHHKIAYRQRLLNNAVEKLAVAFAEKAKREEYQFLKKCRHELLKGKPASSNKNVYNDAWVFVGADKGTKSLQDKYAARESDEQKLDIHEFIKRRRGHIEQESIGNRIFNYNSFVECQQVEVKIGADKACERLFLISDDDIIYLLKKYLLHADTRRMSSLEKEFIKDASMYVMDLFSRHQELFPLWKSRAEFITDFEKYFPISYRESDYNQQAITDKLNKFFEKLPQDKSISLASSYSYEGIPYVVVCNKLSLSSISEGSVFVKVGGEPRCFTTLDLPVKKNAELVHFAHAFVPKIKRRLENSEDMSVSEMRKAYLEHLKKQNQKVAQSK